jgi:hypothetical protein
MSQVIDIAGLMIIAILTSKPIQRVLLGIGLVNCLQRPDVGAALSLNYVTTQAALDLVFPAAESLPDPDFT